MVFWLTLTLVITVAVPIFALAALCLLALLPVREMRGWTRPKAAILIPAHNEESGIGATLLALKTQLHPEDRIIVIADNCTDETADVARAMGAVVLIRQNETQKGKGYALAHGVDFLKSDHPGVVVMIDADCLVEPEGLDAMVRAAVDVGVVQAEYTMASPDNPGVKDHLSAFAFLTKNLVRPRGLDRIGSPVLLTGTGMAFTWSRISDVDLASGNIVEDMQLGIDLALRGRGARICPKARVTGQLPSGEKTALTQRKRWEHGHLRTMLTQVPRLALAGFRRPTLWPLALDLMIPPLAFLAASWVGALVVTIAVWWRYGEKLPLEVHALSGLIFFIAAGVAWGRFGRGRIPLGALLAVPLYIVWKVPLYVGFLFRPERKWVRTEREDRAGKV